MYLTDSLLNINSIEVILSDTRVVGAKSPTLGTLCDASLACLFSYNCNTVSDFTGDTDSYVPEEHVQRVVHICYPYSSVYAIAHCSYYPPS